MTFTFAFNVHRSTGRGVCAMEIRMHYVRGHVEVYDAQGQFLFSADSESEAERMLEE